MHRAVAGIAVQRVSIRLRSVGPEKSVLVYAALVLLWFQSVSGLWDRRNLIGLTVTVAVSLFQSVSGLWDRRNLTSPTPKPRNAFQSVSGLWDRRNCSRAICRLTGTRFNPSPVCGTGEMVPPHREREQARVSIRLRSVGPEKSLQVSFAALSKTVSIRLRSVGPEKFRVADAERS